MGLSEENPKKRTSDGDFSPHPLSISPEKCSSTAAQLLQTQLFTPFYSVSIKLQLTGKK